VPRVREVWSSNPERLNLTQRYKQFTTASTATQVAVLPWCYDAEMATANSLHTSAYTGSVIKDMAFGKLMMRICSKC